MPVPLDSDRLENLMKQGLATPPGQIADPSDCPALAQAGVAVVTSYLEQLALLELVARAEPIFGKQGGMWIGYELTSKGREVAADADSLRRALAPLTGGAATEVAEAVHGLLEECRSSGVLSRHYEKDFLRTLEEIAICFDHGCFIATISLCGKVLEVCLKETLLRNGIEPQPGAMIGNLVGYIDNHLPHEYADRSLRDVARVINTSRATAIHADHTIPIPSRDQAVMVIFAMRDVVKRHLASAAANGQA